MALETIGGLLEVLDDVHFVGTSHAKRRRIRGFSTDSRSLKKGEVFCALSGEQFDGHNFLSKVAHRAAAAIVSSNWFARQHDVQLPLPLVVVDDTLTAYGAIATIHRMQFGIPVIAVAGSNGKTTTKDLVAGVLASRYRVLATEGNLNNLIGVPATMLRINEEHQVAVVEIGTNMPGEIARLCEVLRPTHGVITNIGREHLELLGSLDGVAREECALFDFLSASGGTAFVNLDDRYLRKAGLKLKKRVTYGRTARADVQASVGSLNEWCAPQVTFVDRRGSRSSSFTAQLNTPGVHTALNALAAVAIGRALKVPLGSIRTALEAFAPLSYRSGYGRLAMMQLPNGARLLNDTYNSNPESVGAALQTLSAMQPGPDGRRVAVLADMKELGEQSAEEHRLVGQSIAAGEGAVDVALFHGDEMRHGFNALKAKLPKSNRSVYARFFKDKTQLATYLRDELRGSDVILVKGSRGMAMEEIVRTLMNEEALR
jgi:UDP-N-acetylmuramoyl-tripeptide--D-alanyl-D-alanine ligase